ncbi:MAG: 2-oxoglutarate and iron-dependent oxygenase domain-containing protein, partial [Rhodospirillales bacterium]|nr:2-oxoglutarate and iron-dependent oxygenase domain-containing protein [Rhodospirillales bacterium]
MTQHAADTGIARLPIIDMTGLGEPGADARIAAELDDAFSRIGFAYFRNIGVAPDLVETVFTQSRRFHALPGEAKRRLTINEFHR